MINSSTGAHRSLGFSHFQDLPGTDSNATPRHGDHSQRTLGLGTVSLAPCDKYVLPKIPLKLHCASARPTPASGPSPGVTAPALIYPIVEGSLKGTEHGMRPLRVAARPSDMVNRALMPSSEMIPSSRSFWNVLAQPRTSPQPAKDPA